MARFGEKGSGPGQFLAPQAVSVDPRGFLYVADTGNDRVQKLDASGRCIATVGGFGRGREQFNAPVSVWAENGLDVFVADYTNGRIERYDKDLHYIGSMVSSDAWPEALRFGFPLDVILTTQSELFCLDGENSRILKLDVLGNPQLAFGGYDTGDGRLVDPQRLAVSSENRVYVTDGEGGRVLVYDAYGNFLAAVEGTPLEKPAGLCDAPGTGLVLVADPGSRRVVALRGLAPVWSFGGETVPEATFSAPVDVCYRNGRLVVLDRARAECFVFQWFGAPGEAPP
jgi:DNA-binding beta-propeller fold protein YncE